MAFGIRDGQEQAAHGSQSLPPALFSLDLVEIQRRGVDATVADTVAHLTRAGGPSGFWIHIDADVLDDLVMPAVDYRLPGGLSWKSLTCVFHVATQADRAVGLEITIYSPTLDAQGDGAHRLVHVLGEAMGVGERRTHPT